MVKVILGGWDLRIIKGGYAEESTLDIMMEKPPGILVRIMRTFDYIPATWTCMREKIVGLSNQQGRIWIQSKPKADLPQIKTLPVPGKYARVINQQDNQD